jgi:hypothetical protein
MHQQILLLFIYGLVSPEVKGGGKTANAEENTDSCMKLRKRRIEIVQLTKSCPAKKMCSKKEKKEKTKFPTPFRSTSQPIKLVICRRMPLSSPGMNPCMPVSYL